MPLAEHSEIEVPQISDHGLKFWFFFGLLKRLSSCLFFGKHNAPYVPLEAVDIANISSQI